MGRLHPTMNLQEKLITTAIFLVAYFILQFILVSTASKTDKSGTPSEQLEKSIKEAAGCFGGCLSLIFWIGLALGFIALVLYGIIKAIKYAWFF